MTGGQWLLFVSMVVLVGTLSWLAVVLCRAVKGRAVKGRAIDATKRRHPAGKDLNNGR